MKRQTGLGCPNQSRKRAPKRICTMEKRAGADMSHNRRNPFACGTCPWARRVCAAPVDINKFSQCDYRGGGKTSNILAMSRHPANLYEEGELDRDATFSKLETVQMLFSSNVQPLTSLGRDRESNANPGLDRLSRKENPPNRQAVRGRM